MNERGKIQISSEFNDQGITAIVILNVVFNDLIQRNCASLQKEILFRENMLVRWKLNFVGMISFLVQMIMRDDHMRYDYHHGNQRQYDYQISFHRHKYIIKELIPELRIKIIETLFNPPAGGLNSPGLAPEIRVQDFRER